MREVLRPRSDVRGMEKGRGNVRGRKIWTLAARNFQNAKTAACSEEEPEPFRLQWNFYPIEQTQHSFLTLFLKKTLCPILIFNFLIILVSLTAIPELSILILVALELSKQLRSSG